MARPRKAMRRKVQKPSIVSWNEHFTALFRLGTAFAPPVSVQVRSTAKGHTFVAVFRDADGQAWRATTRTAWIDDGARIRVIDETISATFRTEQKA